MNIEIEDLIDAAIVDTLKQSIAILEADLEKEDRWELWFKHRELDIAATKHLIHCMKVVSDWYTVPSDGFFFDYTVTEVPNEDSRNS